ncbi:hypothetical protein DM02DRAFT_619879 [Periconia macrospinosa]|uniref:Uncharacterized protein n=1 Tax=Periconia macrospinosa TaxID=97972 RepID=A0A2V1D3G9_9PLEO|nr:hypothetical protein DM02DRAFT_619879 [Periconia macrospinosa]
MTANTGPYWDPLGEYETKDTIYTLTVYTPPRPPSSYIPSIFTRKPLNISTVHIIRPPEDKPNYDCFEAKDLPDMKTTTVKIKSCEFDLDMRCDHVLGTGNNSKVCEQGCYVLEKGGKVSRWLCKRRDCEGHVYTGDVKKNEDEVACFGKKGQRMVCVKRAGN